MKTRKLDYRTCCAILVVCAFCAVFVGSLLPSARAAGANGQLDIGVQLQPNKPTDDDIGGQATVAFTKDTLRGLEGVWVVVTRRESRAEKYGLTMRSLKSEIETQLQHNNIHIFSQKEYSNANKGGILCIDILPLISEEMGFSAVSINIALMQNVMLTGGNAARICQATTWERRTVALCDLESIREIPQNVTGFVDHFIKDFNSANVAGQTQEPATKPEKSEPEIQDKPEHKVPPKFMMI